MVKMQRFVNSQNAKLLKRSKRKNEKMVKIQKCENGQKAKM